MPNKMPDRMPEDMADRMPEDMPDRMPEDARQNARRYARRQNDRRDFQFCAEKMTCGNLLCAHGNVFTSP